MNYYLYDGSFEGFLSAVFYAFESKINPDDICKKENFQDNFFAHKIYITSDEEKATRVWNGIVKFSGKRSFDMLYRVFLSELEGVEMLLFNYIGESIRLKQDISGDFGNPMVQEVHKIHKKVAREADRVLMFIRFRQAKDNLYVATFEPKYNVLPISIDHFKDRFADQKWLIYDSNRQYGYYYDLENVQEVCFVENNHPSELISKDLLSENEEAYQTLWQDYFDSINIKERKNLKLQMQHMPKRFWKNLPEKNRR